MKSMKYTKKMKLVEIDDNNYSLSANNTMNIDDDSYLKPRVMPTLDNAMNEILRAPISDGDKWKLYSQALQRYLNHVKITSRKNENNFSYPVNNVESKTIPVAEDEFNFTLGSLSEPAQLDISGVQRVRDSLDSISQPVVRDFFQKVREIRRSAPSSSPSIVEEEASQPPRNKKRKKKVSSARRVLPYRNASGAAGRKRPAENSLSHDISRMRPCKVALNRLNWEPTTAR